MSKFAIIIFALFLMLPVRVIADDFFDNYAGIEHAWDGQKSITNKEFEEAINTLTKKQKKKEARAKKRKIKKISGGGTSLHKGLEPMSEISAQDELKKKGEFDGQLINIPVDVIIDDKILEKGYYNVFGEKDNNGDIYFSFYQAHYLKGKVKAYKTKNDFDSDNLDFVKMEPYDDNYIRIMYGSLDFNAYTYLRYIKNWQRIKRIKQLISRVLFLCRLQNELFALSAGDKIKSNPDNHLSGIRITPNL